MTELRPLTELAEPTRELVQKALSMRGNAYAPYSKFQVGAALRDAGGKIHSGCNVENASFGAVICAERSAVVQMVSGGGKKITELALVTTAPEAFFPCGICLQVIQEFGGGDVVVVAVDGTGKKFRKALLSELYPSAFSKDRWRP